MLPNMSQTHHQPLRKVSSPACLPGFCADPSVKEEQTFRVYHQPVVRSRDGELRLVTHQLDKVRAVWGTSLRLRHVAVQVMLHQSLTCLLQSLWTVTWAIKRPCAMIRARVPSPCLRPSFAGCQADSSAVASSCLMRCAI